MSDWPTLVVVSVMVAAGLSVCIAGWVTQARRRREGRIISTRERRASLRFLPPGLIIIAMIVAGVFWIRPNTILSEADESFGSSDQNTQPAKLEIGEKSTGRNSEVALPAEKVKPLSSGVRALAALTARLAALETTRQEYEKRLTDYQQLINQLRADLNHVQQLAQERQQMVDKLTENLQSCQQVAEASRANLIAQHRNRAGKARPSSRSPSNRVERVAAVSKTVTVSVDSKMPLKSATVWDDRGWSSVNKPVVDHVVNSTMLPAYPSACSLPCSLLSSQPVLLSPADTTLPTYEWPSFVYPPY